MSLSHVGGIFYVFAGLVLAGQIFGFAKRRMCGVDFLGRDLAGERHAFYAFDRRARFSNRIVVLRRGSAGKNKNGKRSENGIAAEWSSNEAFHDDILRMR